MGASIGAPCCRSCQSNLRLPTSAKVRGLANKKPSEIFAAITRWIDAKLVRRKERGVYEKIE